MGHSVGGLFCVYVLTHEPDLGTQYDSLRLIETGSNIRMVVQKTAQDPYLGGQIYRDPRPKELMLRNHV